MTTTLPSPLEAALRDLSRWHGESTSLARTALSRASRPGTPRPALRAAAFAAIVVLILSVVIGVLTPALGKARASRRVAGNASVQASYEAVEDKAFSDGDIVLGRSVLRTGLQSDRVDEKNAPQRQLIQRARIAVQVPQVRSTFEAVKGFVREGEFVESAEITGSSSDLRAALVLRVHQERLGAVLASLRALGEVVSENIDAADVTDQLLDLDAQLRNEREIERELLKLLDDRKADALKDVIEARAELARIRTSIERLAARREALGRDVALATITVSLVGPADLPKPEPVKGFGTRLLEAIDRGVDALKSFALGAVEILIAGAVVWIVLLVAIVAGWRLYRRAQRRAALEPPPSV